MTVIMINSFEVAEENDAAFLQAWNNIADRLRNEPGYISTRLHQSLDPKAKFRFVNVAEWESPQDFQKAINKESGQKTFQSLSIYAHPSLYRIVKE